MQSTRREFLRAALAAGGAWALGLDGRAASAQQGPPAPWDFARTWVFATGILRWQDAESWEPFPQEGRRDAVWIDALRRRGVPADQIVFLRDEHATRTRMIGDLDALLARMPADGSLLFYFAGHGHRVESGEGYFVSFDAGEDMAASTVGFAHVIERMRTRFRGARALLFADCCYSGALVELSVGRPGGPPRAVFGASSASELSTEHWTFTDALIDGIEGAPNVDVDGDGRVTIGDLASFIEAEMAFAEGQLSTCRASGISMATALVPARPRPHPRYGERVDARVENRWWPATILAVEGDRIRVHYDGWEGSWDESLPSDRVRPYVPEHHALGSLVQVRSEGRWYPARVLEARLGVHRVHYEGFEAVWDEWVARERIRPRGRGSAAPRTGRRRPGR